MQPNEDQLRLPFVLIPSRFPGFYQVPSEALPPSLQAAWHASHMYVCICIHTCMCVSRLWVDT